MDESVLRSINAEVAIANSMDESVLRSINSQLVVRPRATVDGGTKQLKRLNRTKKSLRRGGEWNIAKTRGLVRVNQKLGPA